MKKTLLIVLITLGLFTKYAHAQVAIGKLTPDPAAQLDIYSTEKGLLVPRLTVDKILNMTTLAEGLIVYNISSHKPCYYNGTQWLYFDNTAVTRQIGDSYGGGIIVYIDNTGKHGLVAASTDQSTSAEWGCSGTFIPGNGTAFGTGQANTSTIIANCSTAGIAARLCDALVLNGYSDWYLPSLDEARYICAAKSYLNLTNSRYYTSSQVDGNSAVYFTVYSPNNTCDFNGGDLLKNFRLAVRAVRSF